MIIVRNHSSNDKINDIHLRVLDFGYAKADYEWSGNLISPMYSRLYYIMGGDPYILKGEKRIPLEIGKCYLLPTGYSCRYACDSLMEQLYFHININDFNGTDFLRCATHILDAPIPDGVVSRMQEHMQSSNPLDSLLLKNEVYSSVLGLLKKYNINLKSTNYSRCVLLAVEHIQKNLNLKLTISELAVKSFVSESTLAKKFKSELGVTIGDYIDNLVLFEAERLLLKSDLTVLQISERFGFCDQFYFSRKFKQKYGEAPQKYRKLHLI